MTEPIFLPVLHSFENGNPFTGSFGLLRYKITPNTVMLNKKEVNLAESSLTGEYWHGQFCYENSAIEGEKTVPMSDEGIETLRAWLREQIR